jgi:predicted ATPase
MIYLDDIHNADEWTLRFVQAILTDRKRVYSSSVEDGGCIFFVSCHSDKVPDQQGSQHVDEFIRFLEYSDVPSDRICLNELTESDVNLLLSQTLGIVPRLCKEFSRLVHLKTKGNAFYVHQFLDSLIDKDIVKFSLREKKWHYDVDLVASQAVTDNVVDMIVDKISQLSAEMQFGLKAVACFGANIDVGIVQELSKTALYANLQSTLDGAVDAGYLERNESQYFFIHEKVRGAALSLIKIDKKAEFFYALGILLYTKLTDPEWIEKVPIVLDLINHGVPSLITCEEKRAFIAELNYAESVKAFDAFDFTSARVFVNKAISLLPNHHWTDHYDQSAKYFLQLVKAVHSCGDIDTAKGTAITTNQ